MNWDQVAGQWKQFKGQVRERWGKLTDDDLEVVNGRSEQLVGVLQKRYGIAKDAAEAELNEFLRKLREPEESQSTRAKEARRAG